MVRVLLVVSRGPTRILSLGRSRVVFSFAILFAFVLILSVPTPEQDLALLVIDLEAFRASVGFLVLGVVVFFLCV